MTPTIEAIKREILGEATRLPTNDYESGYTDAVIQIAYRLDACLAKAVVVYTDEFDRKGWSIEKGPEHTHTAILLNIQPIEKAVTKQELKDALWVAEHKLGTGIFGELATRLDDHGVKEAE